MSPNVQRALLLLLSALVNSLLSSKIKILWLFDCMYWTFEWPFSIIKVDHRLFEHEMHLLCQFHRHEWMFHENALWINPSISRLTIKLSACLKTFFCYFMTKTVIKSLENGQDLPLELLWVVTFWCHTVQSVWNSTPAFCSALLFIAYQNTGYLWDQTGVIMTFTTFW